MEYQEYGYEKLEVYQLSEELVAFVYKITLSFPKEELFVLTSQIRRAIVSVPLNIAEGSSRKSKKDFCHYIVIAIGSLIEAKVCLKLSLNLKYITIDEFTKLIHLIDKLFFKLIALKKYLLK